MPFVNCCQFMYLVISLLVLRAGCGIWLYQFLIIAYLFYLCFINVLLFILGCAPPLPLPTLDYLWSINCINVGIHGYNCCQTGGIEVLSLSKCVYLASMVVKIERTVGVQNISFFFFFFQNVYLIVMSAETLATIKVKIAEIYVLVRRNIMIYTEN